MKSIVLAFVFVAIAFSEISLADEKEAETLRIQYQARVIVTPEEFIEVLNESAIDNIRVPTDKQSVTQLDELAADLLVQATQAHEKSISLGVAAVTVENGQSARLVISRQLSFQQPEPDALPQLNGLSIDVVGHEYAQNDQHAVTIDAVVTATTDLDRGPRDPSDEPVVEVTEAVRLRLRIEGGKTACVRVPFDLAAVFSNPPDDAVTHLLITPTIVQPLAKAE